MSYYQNETFTTGEVAFACSLSIIPPQGQNCIYHDVARQFTGSQITQKYCAQNNNKYVPWILHENCTCAVQDIPA